MRAGTAPGPPRARRLARRRAHESTPRDLGRPRHTPGCGAGPSPATATAASHLIDIDGLDRGSVPPFAAARREVAQRAASMWIF